MEKALSSLRTFVLFTFLAVSLLTSGCAQQKVFDFSAPVAQMKLASKMLSEDSVRIVDISSDTAALALSQDTYQLEASIDQPVPAKLFPRHMPTSAVSIQAMSTSKGDKLAKRIRKATAQDPNSSSLPLPFESKAALVFGVISLLILGFLLAPGFTIGTYLTAMLIGLITFSFSFAFGLLGKSKGAKQPEKYNAKGAKRIGVFSLTLAALLALILLALLIV